MLAVWRGRPPIQREVPRPLGAQRGWIDQHAIFARLANEQLEVVGSERSLLEEEQVSSTVYARRRDEVTGELTDALQERDALWQPVEHLACIGVLAFHEW